MKWSPTSRCGSRRGWTLRRERAVTSTEEGTGRPRTSRTGVRVHPSSEALPAFVGGRQLFRREHLEELVDSGNARRDAWLGPVFVCIVNITQQCFQNGRRLKNLKHTHTSFSPLCLAAFSRFTCVFEVCVRAHILWKIN